MGNVYEYKAPWTIYAMGWSLRPDKPFRLGLGSFVGTYTNKVSIVQLDDPNASAADARFEEVAAFDHPYPPTKLQFIPDPSPTGPDLIATTGDYLRIWEIGPEGRKDGKAATPRMRCLLNNNKNSEFCAPLTSFDWNSTDRSLIGTSSIDTTCTIWDVNKQEAVTQLIAHDKEVYDMSFRTRHRDVFASVGADGSVRMFDLRNLKHSTIIYESPELQPLLRLSWNCQDEHYLATFSMNGNRCTLLDARVPSLPAAELQGHVCPMSAVSWAPHSSVHICTAGDDHQALIWDLRDLPKPVEDPILAYTARGPINQLQWSGLHPHWISIAFGSTLQALRV